MISININVNVLTLRLQSILCSENAPTAGGLFRDSLHLPSLPILLGDQKQFARRFSSFQIPMGLLRLLQGVEMLDPQL
jgi:hypothetical protein